MFKKACDLVLVFICFFLIFSMGLGVIFFPKHSFSESENRALASLSMPSAQELFHGEFISDLSAFYCDHLPFRTSFVRASSVCELSLGKQLANGVAVFSDGTLVPRCEYDDLSLLYTNLSAVSLLPDDSVICILPRSVDVFGLPSLKTGSESVRSAYETVIQSGLDSTGVASDVSTAHELGERVFYRTDHHLTTYGAYVVYRSLSRSLGYEPHNIEYFDVSTICTSFFGTSHSRVGAISCPADSIEFYRHAGDDSFEINCEDAACDVCSLYDLSALDSKDKYRVFLGGNHSLISIKSQQQKPSLLIIKDSFANALIPFLAIHYDVTAIDPRYADFSIKEYLASHSFDSILFLCGTDTLATDRSFIKLRF